LEEWQNKLQTRLERPCGQRDKAQKQPTSGRARQTMYQLLSEVRTTTTKKKPHFEGLGKRFQPVTLRHTSLAAKLGNSCLSRLWPRSGVSSLRGRGLFIDCALGQSGFESRQGQISSPFLTASTLFPVPTRVTRAWPTHF
jgi:hypothetical protein